MDSCFRRNDGGFFWREGAVSSPRLLGRRQAFAIRPRRQPHARRHPGPRAGIHLSAPRRRGPWREPFEASAEWILAFARMTEFRRREAASSPLPWREADGRRLPLGRDAGQALRSHPGLRAGIHRSAPRRRGSWREPFEASAAWILAFARMTVRLRPSGRGPSAQPDPVRSTSIDVYAALPKLPRLAPKNAIGPLRKSRRSRSTMFAQKPPDPARPAGQRAEQGD